MRVCATMPYLLSFLTLLSPALTHSFTENIDVLVFVPRNNSYLFSHARVAPALLYAQRSLGADGGRYSGLSFAVQFANSDCFYEALFTLADKSGAQRPDLILGPVCEYEAAAVVRLASHWNIPVISAGALAAAFKNKKTEYSHLTRIAPSYVKMAEVFGAMFERFTWRSALLVYEDDQEERNCYFTIEGVYHHMIDRYDIHIHHVVEEEPTVTDELLQSIDDSEVVIMCMGADKIRELMLAARKQKMTSGDHMFFNIELFNTSSYGNGSWQRGDKNDDEARKAYASLNTVTLLRSVKPEFENFSIEMHKYTEGPLDCIDCGNVNMFVEGFHDALLLYAIALHEAMKNGYSKKNGTEITSLMWNRTFEGIAGQVSIDDNGDRIGDFSVMTMTNVVTGTYEMVANYFGANKTFQLLPNFSDERFTVRKRHKENLKKSDTSCGLGVSALTGVIVGAVLGTVMLIAFYFFRKNYRITIERRTRAEECDSGKHRQLREDSIRSNFSAA